MTPDRLRGIYLSLRNVNDLAQKAFDRKTAEYAVTTTQYGILKCLPLDGESTMSSLYKQVGCAPSNMTTMIQRLERDAMVGTRKNPQDQRETLVHLTAKGREMREGLEPMYREFLEEAFGVLAEEEREQLFVLLAKLEGHLS